MRRLGLAAVLVLSLGAPACSDSVDSAGAASSGKGKEYADAVAASLLEDEDTPLTEDDARCMANGYVDAIGVDVLEERVTPEELAARSDVLGERIELSEDKAEAVYDALVGCVGVKDLFLIGTEDDSVSEKLADCMDENLDESLAKELFVTILQDEDPTQHAELMGEITAALTPCMAR